jgi:hypothetical protein
VEDDGMVIAGSRNDLQLQEISEADLEELSRFVLRRAGSTTSLAAALRRFSWILLENPARVSKAPLGWFLTNADSEIVGCMCCAPQEFRFGAMTLPLMMANSFYVDERYHGGGTAIFLKYLQLGRRYPLFVSSASPTVAEIWQKLGGRAFAGTDRELIGIVHWTPLLAENLYRKIQHEPTAQLLARLAGAIVPLRRQLERAAGSGKLRRLGSAEEASEIGRQHSSDKITASRDVGFLRWRYFSDADVTTQLLAFQSKDDERPFVLGIRLLNRGYKQQIRTLQVLDIWGEVDGKLCRAIAASLWREYGEQIDALLFRCLGPEQEQSLMECGFRRRVFAAPIAWRLDKWKLLPAQAWYFVPADGDMFL